MPTPHDHSHQIALVTGASSGIGRATALALHQAGYTVYASARSIGALEELSAQGLQTVSLDVTDDISMMRAVNQIEQQHGPVTLLINNAGYGLNGPVEELSMEDLRRQFETNVFGLIRMSQLVLPGMRRLRRGRIINIGSVGDSFTLPGIGAYSATKYALEAINDALRSEVRSFGVDIVLVRPSPVFSNFDAVVSSSFPPDLPGQPYAAFKARVQVTLKQIFDPTGPNLAGSLRPEQVASVIVQAARARHPKTRYIAGFSGRMLLFARAALPDRAWDWVLAKAYGVSLSR